MDLTYNPELAKKADRLGESIATTGYYTGHFENVYARHTDSGAIMHGFVFKSDDELKANFEMCTFGKDGKPTFALDMLHAGMACLKVRSAKAVNGFRKVFSNGAEMDMACEVYPDFCNKPIGVILQRVEYEKQDMTIGYKMELKHFIDPLTKQTGGEVQGKEAAMKFEKLLARYSDKNLPRTQDAHNEAKSNGYVKEDKTFAKPDTEEIPFN